MYPITQYLIDLISCLITQISGREVDLLVYFIILSL